MPAFRTGVVAALRDERAGLQKVDVEVDGDAGTGVRAHPAHRSGRARRPRRAQHDRRRPRPRDRRLALRALEPRARRMGRARARPHHEAALHEPAGRRRLDRGAPRRRARRARTIDGLPVVATPLHSQLPAVALGIRSVRPDARIAYVMTDGAALPLALSDLVATLRDRDLVDTTITCGHAFGGDHEAVNVYSALDDRPPRRRRPTSRSWRWARASSAPAPRSASPASRSAPSSTRPSGSAACRSRACGRRRPTPATATSASRTTRSPR